MYVGPLRSQWPQGGTWTPVLGQPALYAGAGHGHVLCKLSGLFTGESSIRKVFSWFSQKPPLRQTIPQRVCFTSLFHCHMAQSRYSAFGFSFFWICLIEVELICNVVFRFCCTAGDSVMHVCMLFSVFSSIVVYHRVLTIISCDKQTFFIHSYWFFTLEEEMATHSSIFA